MYKISYRVDFVFFFSSRRRHTRYWRDWSSDVCSSDLEGLLAVRGHAIGASALHATLDDLHPDVQRFAETAERSARLFGHDIVAKNPIDCSSRPAHGGPQRPTSQELLPARLYLRHELTCDRFEVAADGTGERGEVGRAQRDRKSTRLNSSHANISYAVFCLKKK